MISDALFTAVSHHARAGSPVVLSIPAPDVPVERLFDVFPTGERSLFAPQEGPVSLAGIGRAFHLTAPSLCALKPQLADTLGPLEVVAVAGADSMVRALGGQAFDPRRSHEHDIAWEGFPQASLTLPHWTLTRVAHRSSLQVTFTRDHCPARDAITHVLRTLDASALAARDMPTRATRLPGDREAWHTLVHHALAALRDGRAEKLVAARRVELRADASWPLRDVLSRLDAPAGCARFAFEYHRKIFLGASPERLVVRLGSVAHVDALAGSSPRHPSDAPHDIQHLLESPKERHEHALVVEGIRAALAPFSELLEIPERPAVRTLPWLHHLWSPVRAQLHPAAPAHILDLVTALHPTPALGGSPREPALAWIHHHEPHPRGWYAAPVGWCDLAGDGEFFVAIRAAVLHGARAWAWAGAGIVPGSNPAREWDETEAKLRAICMALGATR